MIRINTILELYDLYILEEIKKKHYFDKLKNYLYAPPEKETGWRLLKENLAKTKTLEDSIMPALFIFRYNPPIPADENYSPSKYAFVHENLRIVDVYLEYTISFYSDNMYDMNEFVMTYYEFQRDRKVYFDFTEYGLEYKQYVEVMFEDLSYSNTIEQMYDVGLYFRYDYTFKILCPLFIIKQPIYIDRIVLSIYNNETFVVEVKKDVE